MFRALFSKRRAVSLPPRPPAALPEDLRLYAVGDIHGRLDLLDQMLDLITEDSKTTALPCQLLFLGDYVDRGMDSKGVIERLMHLSFGGKVPLFLMGNHERSMLTFLENAEKGKNWLGYGGRETVASYGVSTPLGSLSPAQLDALHRAFKAALPPSHAAFMAQMPLFYTCGDYFFAHAGIKPTIPLDQQQERDLLWIRHEFLDWKGHFDKVVVHGHTIYENPQCLPHRIGIDTGAYASGVLTALVLEGTNQRLLQTKPSSPLLGLQG